MVMLVVNHDTRPFFLELSTNLNYKTAWLSLINFHRYLRIIYKKHRKLCGGEQINFFRPNYQSTTIYKTSLVLSTHYKIPDLDSLLGWFTWYHSSHCLFLGDEQAYLQISIQCTYKYRRATKILWVTNCKTAENSTKVTGYCIVLYGHLQNCIYWDQLFFIKFIADTC